MSPTYPTYEDDSILEHCSCCSGTITSTKGKRGGNYYYALGKRCIKFMFLTCPYCHMFAYASLMAITVEESEEFEFRRQFPPTNEIPAIEGLPNRVKKDYAEAFNCFCIGNWNTCAMICRQMLMSVAVDKGAKKKKGKGFDFYVEYLKNQKDVPESIHENLDKIRGTGNKVIHEMPDSTEREAKDAFIGILKLLIAVYEKPARDKRREER